jgi:hypothetical protein
LSRLRLRRIDVLYGSDLGSAIATETGIRGIFKLTIGTFHELLSPYILAKEYQLKWLESIISLINSNGKRAILKIQTIQKNIDTKKENA